MSTLTTTRNYADGDDLTEAELDAAFDSLETFCNGNIGTTNIATGGVDTTNIASSAVTAAKIASDAVTTAKILDANVTGAKLATSCADASTLEVSGGSMRIKDGGVTQAKRVALGQQIGSSSGSFSTTSASYVDVTNLSVSITTTGRPVVVFLQGVTTGTYGAGYIGYTGGASEARYQLLRDAVSVGGCSVFGTSVTGLGAPSGTFFFIDTPTTGTYTYKVQALNTAGSSTKVQDCKLVAYEL